MTALARNFLFEGALFGLAALLLWAGYQSLRVRRNEERSKREEFILELVEMLEDMIPEGQGEDFDAAKWIARWLETPQPALDGAQPKEYLCSVDGRALVRRLLGSIESGAYV